MLHHPATVLRYAYTIYISAFLLFQVQPLIARYILPWFGGSPAVWTTSMLFFQAALLGGYAYAHGLSERLAPRKQAVVHGALIALSLLLLPIITSDTWRPQGDELPTWRILALLTVSIGGPYLLLSTTGPLLQRWFSRTEPGTSPYRLYALSNIGSLLALLTYPVVFEPNWDVETQATVWMFGYGLFAAGACWCAYQLYRRDPPEDEAVAADGADGDRPPSVADRLMWIGLAAAPSVLLLAVTNQISQEVAVVPFLWVLPLSLYLLSFILCFDSDRWYRRVPWAIFGFLAIVAAIVVLFLGVDASIVWSLVAYVCVLFGCCMCCHGELAASKPSPRYLTGFFLYVSVGGALGGLLTVLLAPRVFTGFWELHVGLWAAVALVLLAWRRSRGPDLWLAPSRRMASAVLALTALGVLATALGWHVSNKRDKAVATARNFYGILTVTRRNDPEVKSEYYSLRHGAIQHGFQYLDADKAMWATSYYGKGSGVELAINSHPKRVAGQSMRVGVVGLGTGTMAVHGRRNDIYRFYEINPDVIDFARSWFTHLSKTPATVEMVLGDARVKMEQELEAGQPQSLDVLAVDAFSSDSIPMHLMTQECFEVYLKHLAPQGVLAIHVTNRYLDLRPVVRGIAAKLGVEVVWVRFSNRKKDPTLSSSDWLLLTRSTEWLASPAVAPSIAAWPETIGPNLVWTDRYGSLLQVLH